MNARGPKARRKLRIAIQHYLSRGKKSGSVPAEVENDPDILYIALNIGNVFKQMQRWHENHGQQTYYPINPKTGKPFNDNCKFVKNMVGQFEQKPCYRTPLALTWTPTLSMLCEWMKLTMRNGVCMKNLINTSNKSSKGRCRCCANKEGSVGISKRQVTFCRRHEDTWMGKPCHCDKCAHTDWRDIPRSCKLNISAQLLMVINSIGWVRRILREEFANIGRLTQKP